MKKIVMSCLMIMLYGGIFAQVDSTRNQDTMYRNQDDTMWQNKDTVNNHRNKSKWRNRDTMNRNNRDTNWRSRRDRGDSVWNKNRDRMRRDNMDTTKMMRRNMRQDRDTMMRQRKDTMVMGSENQWNRNGNMDRNTWDYGQYMPEAALPVTIGNVPGDVVSSLKGDQGEVYKITTVRLNDNDNAYSVVTITNGVANYKIVDGSGNEITYPPLESNMGNNMNNAGSAQGMTDNKDTTQNNQ